MNAFRRAAHPRGSRQALESRLTAYSTTAGPTLATAAATLAATAVTLALPAAAEAQYVVFHTPSPSSLHTNSTGSSAARLTLPLNSHVTLKFTIGWANNHNTTNNHFTADGSAVVKFTGGDLALSYHSGNDVLKRFAAGNPIGHAAFSGTQPHVGLADRTRSVHTGSYRYGVVKYSAQFAPAGPNAYKSGYFGFRFRSGTHYDYGWLRLKVGSDARGRPLTIALVDNGDNVVGAYRTDGQPILAGISSIPEPASVAGGLALLALGAVGIREWRRRRQPAA